MSEDLAKHVDLAYQLEKELEKTAKVETERNMTTYFAHELRASLHAIDSALNSMPDNLSPTAKSFVDAMQLSFNDCIQELELMNEDLASYK